MQEDIKIKKVKLLKEGEKLELEYQETGEMDATNDKICLTPVHKDLKDAVSGLAVHLAILTDYIPEKKAKDTEEIEKFVCTGYSIGGKEDQEGVTITGYRKTKRGGTVTLNTPFLRFEQSDESQYMLIGDIESKIETIEGEVRQYLFEGKRAPEQQTAMAFPDNGVEA